MWQWLVAEWEPAATRHRQLWCRTREQMEVEGGREGKVQSLRRRGGLSPWCSVAQWQLMGKSCSWVCAPRAESPVASPRGEEDDAALVNHALLSARLFVAVCTEVLTMVNKHWSDTTCCRIFHRLFFLLENLKPWSCFLWNKYCLNRMI